MPDYPWLAEAHIDGNDLQARMRALRMLGDPYSEEDIAGAPDAVRDKTELDALVAYLQGLGVTAAPPRRGDAMSELAGHLIGVMIVLMMLVFIGIWIWAWLPHHKNEFGDLARLPLDEERSRAMSGFWSVWVMVLACVTAGISLFLFVWGIRMRIPTVGDGTTGHVWAHGVAARRRASAAGVVGGDFRRRFLVRRGLSISVSGLRQHRRQARLDFAGRAAARRRRQRCTARGAPRILAHARRRAARGEPRRGQHRPSPLSRQLRRLPRHRRPGQSRRGRARSHGRRLAVRRRRRDHPDQHPRWPQLA